MSEHGIRVQLQIEGKYAQRYHGVEEYMKQSATVNPFAKFIYQGPGGEIIEYKRTVNELPELPKPIKPHHEQIEKIFRTIQSYQFTKPPLDCLSPITEEKFMEGLKKEFKLDFVAAVSRPPSVYRGNH